MDNVVVRSPLRRRGAVGLPIFALVAGAASQDGGATADSASASVASYRRKQALSACDIARSCGGLAPTFPVGAPARSASDDRGGFGASGRPHGAERSVVADHIVIQKRGLVGGAVNPDSVAYDAVQSARATEMRIEFWVAGDSPC